MDTQVLVGAMIITTLLLACSSQGDKAFSSNTTNHAEVNAGDHNLKDVAIKWKVYTDPTFGYSLSYPVTYAIVEEKQSFPEIHPDLTGRLRFLPVTLANSDFAELEPPTFSIEVYSNNSRKSLRDSWINENTAGGDMVRFKVDNKTCTMLTQQRLIAPNQFVFCEHRGNIYKITPLGPKSQEMLTSFKFGNLSDEEIK